LLPNAIEGDSRSVATVAFTEPTFSLWLLLLVATAAVLYSSVGHGGASGYLAAMAVFGLDPALMKPAALSMNIFVTAVVLVRLAPAGHFNHRLFVPLVIGSMPMAFLGGAFLVTASVYKVILGVCLLFAFWRLLWERRDEDVTRPPSPWLTVPIGAVLGFVAGMIGVGGGIFLSPLLLFFHWTNMRGSAAIAAAFILVNSVAGLAGYATVMQSWPAGIPLLVAVAVCGGLLGSELGARRIPPLRLRKVLGLVLAIAGLKMIATA
jgi:uncharacterized membrane protein YfcA